MQAEAECPPSDEIRRKRVFSAIAFHTEKVRFVRGGCSAALCFGTARGVHRFENLVQLRLQGRHVAHAVQTILQGFQIDSDHWRHLYMLLGLIWGLAALGPGGSGREEQP